MFEAKVKEELETAMKNDKEEIHNEHRSVERVVVADSTQHEVRDRRLSTHSGLPFCCVAEHQQPQLSDRQSKIVEAMGLRLPQLFHEGVGLYEVFKFCVREVAL